MFDGAKEPRNKFNVTFNTEDCSELMQGNDQTDPANGAISQRNLEVSRCTESTPEYRAFRHHYGNLEIGLDPASVAPHAFAKGLLTTEENDAAMFVMYRRGQRVTVILTAVTGKILGDPRAFHTFVEILGLELAFNPLVEKLKGTRTIRHVEKNNLV